MTSCLIYSFHAHLLHTPPTHLNSEKILALPQQYTHDSENGTLNCTTNSPNAFIMWLRGEDDNNTVEIGDGVIGDVRLEDEGTHICQDFIGQI